VTDAVERAQINVDGSLNSWMTDRAMPSSRASQGVTAVGRTIYVAGGYTGTYCSDPATSVIYATVQPDRSLSTWQEASAPLSTGRMSVAVAGKRLYASDQTRLETTVEAHVPGW
jgi:hypothetical protein